MIKQPQMGSEHKYEGLLVVDKEIGPTSHDVVALLRRITGMRRIGHCGTLDPLATGVLVVCLGGYTRLNEWLSAGEKEYRVTCYLGATSDTLDAQGEITRRTVEQTPRLAVIERELEDFKGLLEQIPPAFSAIKVQGVRSYERARRKEAVYHKAREVHVASIEVAAYDFPLLSLHIACSKGTYVRSLAADLGEKLGCGAYVQELRRLRVGYLDLDDAWTLIGVEEAKRAGKLEECFVPVRRALGDLSEVLLDGEEMLRAFAHGNPLCQEEPEGGNPVCAVYDPAGGLVGIGEHRNGWLKPKKVLRRFDSQAEVTPHGC